MRHVFERTLALLGRRSNGQNHGRVIIVNLYGVGNCILTTPTISALCSLGLRVDVLVHRKRFSNAVFENWSSVDNIFYHDGSADERPRYDHALWAHPIWPGHYYSACRVNYVNPSPGDARPYYMRFKRHEVLEILELARSLGYDGAVPDLHPPTCAGQPIMPKRPVAIGIGYLKSGNWKRKHWGNDRFAECCQKLMAAGFTPILVGDARDQEEDGWIIQRDSGALSVCGKLSLAECFKEIQECEAFIGNDTGLMHAAAAYKLPTVGIFRVTDPVKNAPWGSKCIAVPAEISADSIISKLRELLSAD